MILFELFEPAKQDYQDQDSDQSVVSKMRFRKTRLTLRQLNKMRRVNDVREAEIALRIQRAKTQYQPPPQQMM